MKKVLLGSFIVCSFLALAGDGNRKLPAQESVPSRFEFPLIPIDLGQSTAKHAGKSIPDLISDLGSSVYSDRALASRELLRRGDESVPALLEAKKSSDTEVRSRANDALALLTSPIVVDIEAYSERLIQHAEKVAFSQRWATDCENVQNRLRARDGRADDFRKAAEEASTAFDGVIALRQTVGTLTRQRAELETRQAAVRGRDAVKERTLQAQIDASQKVYDKISDSLRAADESFVAKSQDLIVKLARVDGGLITKDFAFRIRRKKLVGVAFDDALRVELAFRAGLPLEAQRAANFRSVPVLLTESKATPEAQENFKVWFEPSLVIDITTLACTPVLDWGGAVDEKNPEQDYKELDAFRSVFRRMYPD